MKVFLYFSFNRLDISVTGEEPPCHQPMWFKREKDEITGELIYKSNGQYWKCKESQDWTGCPEIYL